MADEPMPGIVVYPPAKAVIGLVQPLGEFAHAPLLAGRPDAGFLNFIELRRQQRIDELLAAGAEVDRQIEDLTARIAPVRQPLPESSEERRVGKGRVRTCRSRWTHCP